MADKRQKRVAIVAGVGPGLGAALVRKLANEGCCIGMFARSSKFIGKLATELGENALAVPTDVSDAKQVAAGFRKVRERLGPVEILIAHASGSIGEGILKTTPEQFEQSWRTAVFGAFLCAREAVPDMLKLATGRVRPTGGRGVRSFSPARPPQCVAAVVLLHSAAQNLLCVAWRNRSQSSCGLRVFTWRTSSSMA
jgi:NAD(P)-dependent dehydrogenase (short-subunit alcohol dehydrogenase family)